MARTLSRTVLQEAACSLDAAPRWSPDVSTLWRELQQIVAFAGRADQLPAGLEFKPPAVAFDGAARSISGGGDDHGAPFSLDQRTL
jgi:hypothetical protein